MRGGTEGEGQREGARKKRREGKEGGAETDTQRYTLPPLPSSVLLRSFMTAEMRASSVFWNPAPSFLDLRMELYFCRNDRRSGCQHTLDGSFNPCPQVDFSRNTSSDAAPALLQDNPWRVRDGTS